MLERYRAKVEAALPACLQGDYASLLCNSMAYSLLDGGKRIRPCLLLSVCDMLGGDVDPAVPFACALEMIHSYSLIHDDLPAMDNDDFRRGKPSSHKRFGEANAILAGDGLLTAAALLLSEQSGFDAAKEAILNGAMRMVSGQSYDLNATERTEEMLHLLHEQKTGALFRAAVVAGACLAGESDSEGRFARLGDAIGLLFQITDDFLDAEQDRKENKFTYVSFYGEEQSRKYIRETEQTALSLLEPYRGDAAEELRNVIRKMVNRTE